MKIFLINFISLDMIKHSKMYYIYRIILIYDVKACRILAIRALNR